MLQFHLERILNWLVPRACVICGLASDDLLLELCAICKTNLPYIKNRCYQCGLALDNLIDMIICGNCRSNTPPFDRLCALFSYEPPITTLINQLKFSKKLFPGLLFGDLLTQAVTQHWYHSVKLPDLIIPVPLHSIRHKNRGYNQTLEICKPLAKKLHIPLRKNICRRIKYTKQQSSLNKAKRSTNVTNAFVAEIDHKYKHVAVVDDVVTTGNTVRAMCMALRTVGVETIDIWCIARA